MRTKLHFLAVSLLFGLVSASTGLAANSLFRPGDIPNGLVAW